MLRARRGRAREGEALAARVARAGLLRLFLRVHAVEVVEVVSRRHEARLVHERRRVSIGIRRLLGGARVGLGEGPLERADRLGATVGDVARDVAQQVLQQVVLRKTRLVAVLCLCRERVVGVIDDREEVVAPLALRGTLPLQQHVDDASHPLGAQRVSERLVAAAARLGHLSLVWVAEALVAVAAQPADGRRLAEEREAESHAARGPHANARRRWALWGGCLLGAREAWLVRPPGANAARCHLALGGWSNARRSFPFGLGRVPHYHPQNA